MTNNIYMNLLEIRKIFAERLQCLMQENNLNTISLSKKINIPSSSISNWIQKRRSIQIDSLLIIANFFGCTTDYLLGIENE